MGALAAPARRSGAPGSELRDPCEVSAAARREGGMERLYYPFNRPVPQGRSSASGIDGVVEHCRGSGRQLMHRF